MREIYGENSRTNCRVGAISGWNLQYIKAQIREQMSGPDLYVLTVGFLALTKTGFSEKKNSSQKK